MKVYNSHWHIFRYKSIQQLH